MPTLYVLRHGQTEYNLQKRVQGPLRLAAHAAGRGAGTRRGALARRAGRAL